MSSPKKRTPSSREGGDGDSKPKEATRREHHPIRVVPLSELKPAPYNPRTISQDALNGLAASLERFGVVEPIIWNQRSKNIVGGHQRFEVLKQRGDAEAQVIVVDLSDADEKALNVTLNNPHIAGSFTDNLQEILTSLQLGDAAMLESLRLDNLLVDFSPLDLEDGGQGALDKKTIVTCPKCGHEFES
jgi:ParB-like nuclease family protein